MKIELYGSSLNHIASSPVSERGNTLRLITYKSKLGLPTQLLHTALTLAIWACGSSEGSPENKPLAVSICIRLLVTTKVWPVGRGGKTSGPSEFLCYHTLCSMLGAVERDFVPSVGVHPEHRVTTDHEHQPELGCFGSDHHH